MKERSIHNIRFRKNFGRIERIIDIPNLIDMQKQSYERFLQKKTDSDLREKVGLQGVFKSVFPIRDFSGMSSLEFVRYSFGEVKYEEAECLQRGMTYEVPMKITVRLIVYDLDKDTGSQTIRDIKEQDIYFGTIPLMTDKGTFIINGTERVVVSQLHRSPGIFFDHDKGKTHSSGRLLYSARIIPLRGSWIDLEFDAKNIVYVRIDRRRKFPVTILLKALGYTNQDLLNFFYERERITIEDGKLKREVNPDFLLGKKAPRDIVHPLTGEVIARKNKKINKRIIKMLQEARITALAAKSEDIEGLYLAQDLVDPATGEVIAAGNEPLNKEKLDLIIEKKIPYFDLLFIDGVNVSSSFRDTLVIDKIASTEEAILEIYKKLRPSNPPTLEVANNFFQNLFFNSENYDLSSVGRLKLNRRLGQDIPLTERTLRKEDILLTVKKLIEIKDTNGPVDDIDHLGNRRVRAVGELLENQYRIGLVRMERTIKERMTLQEIETLMPHDLINPKPVAAVVKEFFGTSQLSQFMDQTNPLSEITHKRRLSALGPGGLTRERAGFEVRDVHPTHYGRICPIETPEGPNIGLIVSLSTYARVNEFGFIETPYRTIKDGAVSREVNFLSAMDEKDLNIAQANVSVDRSGRIMDGIVSARRDGEFVMVNQEEEPIHLMDVSPNQLVSVAASLIPFLENDDANRALMGSNMQRQAVPLLACRAPIIGTGIEEVVARDSGVTVLAKQDGVVEDVDADRVVIRDLSGKESGKALGTGVEIYKMTKFQRSNQNTCFNQRPIIRKGDLVSKGQVIADGPSTERGELALGRNVLVAFMSWGGYNFEDSILVGEHLVKDDVFTSIHIEEFELIARDTKLGREEITRDIPNLGDESLKNLDESGIISIGAEVNPGDILVGKITPKGETQLSPEEKLLRAIFGEKAGDVKDTSLRVPPGIEGIVIDAKVFSRKGVERDSRSRTIEEEEISRIMKDQNDEIQIVQREALLRLKGLLGGKMSAGTIKEDRSGKVIISRGEKFTAERLSRIPVKKWKELSVAKGKELKDEVDKIIKGYQEQVALIKEGFEGKIAKLKRGDELPPGVVKMVKVYVAVKRKLSVGDKMAGRHGNKGVVSRILPAEDMPHFADGTPVDIVLNPLGVPSRMNVGQVMETHLGWVSRELGKKVAELLNTLGRDGETHRLLRKIYESKKVEEYVDTLSEENLTVLVDQFKEGVHMATPVFDGAKEEDIQRLLKLAGLPETGQAILYDGRTGQAFDRPVTVGIMYMMKLHHLVDDKIHARSIGPYSLVTQQPLGGKAQFGGQRLGEMEVWAMEAYGAAFTLQEFLTVKSDDVVGRTRMYEKIVKGDNVLEAGLPESFNVLVKELQSLGLNVELLEGEPQTGTH
ncbi:MAG: DNA-directed RNA polymerase subunit beta [Deltaproteobacteria bacterium RBG_13_43_22]|nr:MAG: DNA-directed RNA polymerase subunit beta [Deltaproteobacteria bacterium RBG_13_43_22]